MPSHGGLSEGEAGAMGAPERWLDVCLGGQAETLCPYLALRKKPELSVQPQLDATFGIYSPTTSQFKESEKSIFPIWDDRQGWQFK